MKTMAPSKEEYYTEERDEEIMFLNDVVQDDPELYFLHTYLHESFGGPGESALLDEEEDTI